MMQGISPNHYKEKEPNKTSNKIKEIPLTADTNKNLDAEKTEKTLTTKTL